MADLSIDQVTEYKETFDIFDPDGDGLVTPKNLGIILRKLGVKSTEEELDQMIRAYDKSGKGSIDFTEFLSLMNNKACYKDREEELRDAFKVFDSDSDGRITAEELKHVMSNLGENFTDDDLNYMITVIDEDNDGFVNFDDFAKALIPK